MEEDCRWVGIHLAGLWLLNIKRDAINLPEFSQWVYYPNHDMEEKLIQGDYDILNSEYGIPHICYVMRQNIEKYSGPYEYAGEALKRISEESTDKYKL